MKKYTCFFTSGGSQKNPIREELIFSHEGMDIVRHNGPCFIKHLLVKDSIHAGKGDTSYLASQPYNLV